MATAKRPSKQAAVATIRRVHPAKASTSSALTDTAHHEQSSGTSCQARGPNANTAQLSTERGQRLRSTASHAPQQQLPTSNVQPDGPCCHGTEQQQAHASRHSANGLPFAEASSSTCESAEADTDARLHACSRRGSEACSNAASVYTSSGVSAEQQRSGQASGPPMKQVTHW